ncbi:unnamed protein product [Lathyrus oleraceus]
MRLFTTLVVHYCCELITQAAIATKCDSVVDVTLSLLLVHSLMSCSWVVSFNDRLGTIGILLTPMLSYHELIWNSYELMF